MAVRVSKTSAPLSKASDSREWLAALRAHGAARDRAVEPPHDLLLCGARFEVSRRRASLHYVRGEELEDIATQAADDALVAVLRKLRDFRGASRFTTWAYKFALLEAGVRLRRRAWQGREGGLDAGMWPAVAHPRGAGPDAGERRGVLGTLKRAIDQTLPPHQREVFAALALNGVPIDVLAERLDTTRGALYKTLHDARRKLRRELAAAGLARAEGD